MTDKYYPEPPSFEQPDFDFAIKENPLLQGARTVVSENREARCVLPGVAV